MEERESGGLGVWILGPIVLFVMLIFATKLLPPADCGIGSEPPSSGRDAFAVIAGTCAVITATAAVFRLIAMRQEGSYLARDAWIGGVALLALVIGIGLSRDNHGGLSGFLAVGALVMVLSLLGLLVTAVLGKGLWEVGALVPAYLLGASCFYVLVAWSILDLNARPLC